MEAEKINQLMNSINLNKIEINAFSEVAKNLINKLDIKDEEVEIYLDACSTNVKKFENDFKELSYSKKLFNAVGYKNVSGYAFGLGIERFAMLIHQIGDLRSLFESDIRLLGQFK